MSGIVDNPFVVFAAFLVAQWIAAYLGDFVRSRRRPAKQDELADLDVVQTAALTLLALIIGFSFSMAVSRYDQRNDYEEAEANAIGTEYLRADLLPAESAPAVRNLIRQWLYQRVVFYQRKASATLGRSRRKQRNCKRNSGRRSCRRRGPIRRRSRRLPSPA